MYVYTFSIYRCYGHDYYWENLPIIFRDLLNISLGISLGTFSIFLLLFEYKRDFYEDVYTILYRI